MPLVKIFCRGKLKVSAADLHKELIPIWGVEKTPGVLKVFCIPVADQSPLKGGDDQTDVYIDIRAKAKADRTPEIAQVSCDKTAALLHAHGHKASVRLELYQADLQLTASKL
mmetsp:Transcript_100637/g.217267  ORF Transcript_100637/g.217267 Transcript_100637/m.217267 type:complete len:112 (-) Transcript_100637:40-375(-)